MKLQPLRGTHDLYGSQAKVFRHIDQTALKVAEKFNCEEMSTPLIESLDVFKRSIGATTDIVSKEMYVFKDRGDELITLRPEGTAGVARAFISNGLSQNLPLKLFYSGPMFRYERPQKGRTRQFHQIGIEYLGFDAPSADIETISLAKQTLEALGLGDQVKLEINTLGDQASRNSYRENLVSYFEKFKGDLSEDSKIRLEKNPLRILDSKDKGDKKLIEGAPEFEDFLNDESKDFFSQVCDGLEKLSLTYEKNSRLVRGLDYYCHTVFEFTTEDLGAQNTVLAGGRYDKLIEQMGGKPTSGIGWAAGVERLSLLFEKHNSINFTAPIALLGLGEAGKIQSQILAHRLRNKGLKVETSPSGNNLTKLMKKADKWRANAAVIIGDQEIENKAAVIKDLATGDQKEIQFEELDKYLLNKYPKSQILI